MVFADQARLHHLRHFQVAACPGIQIRVGNNEWFGGYFQSAENRGVAGVRHVHQNSQSVAFLHDFRAERRQTVQVIDARDDRLTVKPYHRAHGEAEDGAGRVCRLLLVGPNGLQ
jgi:hypothetical protein